jgi:hypothetical protein
LEELWILDSATNGIKDVGKFWEVVKFVDEKTLTELFVNELVKRSKIIESSSRVTKSASERSKTKSLNEGFWFTVEEDCNKEEVKLSIA